MTPAQENGDYDPSLVSEALRQIEHTDNTNQDIELLKDIAAQAYVGESAHFICQLSFLHG
jgi:hypothetical protein